jgi:hypothetical protein
MHRPVRHQETMLILLIVSDAYMFRFVSAASVSCLGSALPLQMGEGTQ